MNEGGSNLDENGGSVLDGHQQPDLVDDADGVIDVVALALQ